MLRKIMLSVLTLVGVLAIVGCSPGGVPNSVESTSSSPGFVTPRQAQALIEANRNNPNFVIIDDQVTPAFQLGHIAGAISIPHGTNFATSLAKLDRNKIYIVYCPTGCGATSATMKELGFAEVYEIEGGIKAWVAQGLPIVRPQS